VAGEGHAVPVEQADGLPLRHPRAQAEQEPAQALRRLAGRVFEGGELLHLVDHPQAVRGIDQQAGGVLDRSARTADPSQLVDEERGGVDHRGLGIGLPADDPDPAARPDPLVAQQVGERA